MSDEKVMIRVNGEEREVSVSLSITGLITELGLLGKRIAVAQNGQVVPKATHASTLLQSGDTIEIVRMVGGG